MTQGFLDIAATPAVRAVQQAMGSREFWEKASKTRVFTRLTEREAAYIAARDSFYIASIGENLWPYVQHRGGSPGFLQVIDETTLAFADLSGNHQYISTGNLTAQPRVALILMDYPNQRRLKIYAQAEILSLDADPDLTARLVDPAARKPPERIIRLHLAAFDWNCPQHITPRFTEAEIAAAIAPLHARLRALEAENATLRETLAQKEGKSP